MGFPEDRVRGYPVPVRIQATAANASGTELIARPASAEDGDKVGLVRLLGQAIAVGADVIVHLWDDDPTGDGTRIATFNLIDDGLPVDVELPFESLAGATLWYQIPALGAGTVYLHGQAVVVRG